MRNRLEPPTGEPVPMGRHPVVDLEGDPKAVPNTPVPGWRLRWVWLPVIGALAALGIGVGILLSEEDEFWIKPPVIEGLDEEPSYAWQVSVPTSSRHTTVDDALVIHPYVLGTDDAVVSFVDLDSGEERWRQDYREYLSGRLSPIVSVRDLPGTNRLAVMLTHDGEGRSTRVLLVNRSDGAVAHTRHISEGAVLGTSNIGRYYLLEHDANGQRISRLRSDDPAGVVWSAPLGHLGDIEELVLFETHGHLLLTDLASNSRAPLRGSVLRVQDGERPEWAEDQSHAYLPFGDVLIQQNENRSLVAIDLRTGEELWRQDDCGCDVLGSDGVLFTRALVPSNSGQSIRELIRRVDLGTGNAEWERLTDYEGHDQMMRVGDDLVSLTVTVPENADFLSTDIPGAETCLLALDMRTGQTRERRCHSVFAMWWWPGEEQLILWDSQRLMALAPDDDEPRWAMNFDGHAHIRDLNGALLVYEAESGTIGVLE